MDVICRLREILPSIRPQSGNNRDRRGRAGKIARFMAFLLAVPAAFAGPGDEPPGFHGMLLFGSEKLFMSHLPMFTDQHRYQGIWEVSFGEAGDELYRDVRLDPDNAKRIFTIAPKQLFRLPELVGNRKSFQADVYVGHFERPGHRLLLEDVDVTVRGVVHWHPFLNEHERPAALSYMLFGAENEKFMVHRISRPPNYDQVLAVSVDTAPDISVLHVSVPGRPDSMPLQAGEQPVHVVTVEPDSPAAVEESRAIGVVSEYYLEQNELGFSDLPDLPEDAQD